MTEITLACQGDHPRMLGRSPSHGGEITLACRGDHSRMPGDHPRMPGRSPSHAGSLGVITNSSLPLALSETALLISANEIAQEESGQPLVL